jgi:hypothetical protein
MMALPAPSMTPTAIEFLVRFMMTLAAASALAVASAALLVILVGRFLR